MNCVLLTFSVFWLYNKIEGFEDGGREHNELDGVT